MLIQRKVESEIQRFLSRDECIILTGARQTGKTSIMLRMKEYLESGGTPCRYFNLENHEYLAAFDEHPLRLFDFIPESKAVQTIFIDEVQYLKDPTNFLKLLYDEHRARVRIVASGSSAFYIDRHFNDSLAGRKKLFEIYTLDFDEYLAFCGQDALIAKKGTPLNTHYHQVLQKHWNTYVRFGGYPKVALCDTDEMRRVLLSEIGSSYVKKDIVEAGLRHADKYFMLMKILAHQTGSQVNINELSRTLALNTRTITEYLYSMTKSYHAALITPYSTNIRKELVKMPKAYFLDNGLRNYFAGNFQSLEQREDRGALLENIVFRELTLSNQSSSEVHYWRTTDQKEVDFVVGKHAYEVKFSRKEYKPKTTAEFRNNYPAIPVSVIDNDSVIKTFYRWTTE